MNQLAPTHRSPLPSKIKTHREKSLNLSSFNSGGTYVTIFDFQSSNKSDRYELKSPCVLLNPIPVFVKNTSNVKSGN